MNNATSTVIACLLGSTAVLGGCANDNDTNDRWTSRSEDNRWDNTVDGDRHTVRDDGDRWTNGDDWRNDPNGREPNDQVFGYQSPIEFEEVDLPADRADQATFNTRGGTTGGLDARTVIGEWPAVAKKAANEMLSKYGQPQGVTPGMLVWKDQGQFECIIASREEFDHQFPMAHKDCLEHFVAYEVPADKFDELARFDGSVIVDRTPGYLSARCDTEAHNILALNLAHDVITGAKTVEEARREYAEAAMQEKQGRMPQIMQELQFTPSPGGAAFPDQPAQRIN